MCSCYDLFPQINRFFDVLKVSYFLAVSSKYISYLAKFLAFQCMFNMLQVNFIDTQCCLLPSVVRSAVSPFVCSQSVRLLFVNLNSLYSFTVLSVFTVISDRLNNLLKLTHLSVFFVDQYMVN